METRFQDFVKPQYGGNSIANIPDTVSKLLRLSYNRPLNNNRIEDFVGVKNVVLLLLDGLGSRAVQSAREKFGVPSFDSVAAGSLYFDITSVFPSTTASAMASIHSGLTPQEHGVIGYTMYLQELGIIAQMLRFSPVTGGRSLFDLGFNPETFLGGATIHQKLEDNGIDSTIYSPRYLLDSGLSQLTYRGALIEPQNSIADMIVRLRKNLEKNEDRSLHLAYHPSPDTLSHAHGPYSEEFSVELESIFAVVRSELLRKLDRQIARDTVLIITGDHGAVRIEKQNIVDLIQHPDLVAMLKLPATGDSRAAILHTKEGKEDEVKKYFDEKFNDLFEVVDSKDLLDQGFFGLGKVKEETRDRIGNLVAIPKSYNAIDNSLLDPTHGSVPGRHGGASEEEMKVPCIMRRLD